MNDKRLSNCMLYPAGLYGARSVIFTYTKTILVWFYTPSMNHGKRSAKVRFGKPAAQAGGRVMVITVENAPIGSIAPPIGGQALDPYGARLKMVYRGYIPAPRWRLDWRDQDSV